jgi:hypothetical protein
MYPSICPGQHNIVINIYLTFRINYLYKSELAAKLTLKIIKLHGNTTSHACKYINRTKCTKNIYDINSVIPNYITNCCEANNKNFIQGFCQSACIRIPILQIGCYALITMILCFELKLPNTKQPL